MCSIYVFHLPANCAKFELYFLNLKVDNIEKLVVVVFVNTCMQALKHSINPVQMDCCFKISTCTKNKKINIDQNQHNCNVCPPQAPGMYITSFNKKRASMVSILYNDLDLLTCYLILIQPENMSNPEMFFQFCSHPCRSPRFH